MDNYFLFRIRTIIPEQREFFEGKDIEKPSSELIKEAIHQHRNGQVIKKQDWKTGNIDDISNEAIFFFFGKTSKIPSNIYEDKDFKSVEIPDAPLVYIIFDQKTQVCAMMPTKGISLKNASRNLAKSLSETKICYEYKIKIIVNPIPDIKDFMGSIHDAKAIYKFTMGFSPPNPPDLDELIEKPLQDLLKSTDGDAGKISIRGGEGLNKEEIEKLTRLTVAGGNNATAHIIPPDDDVLVIKKTSKNQSSVYFKDGSKKENRIDLLEKIRKLFYKIRGKDE